MTRPFDPNRLQFYLTIPSPCPYLEGRMERKIFTQLDPLSGPHLNNYLTHAGFRRSQNVIYRPACEACRECKSLRILARAFDPSKSLRRTLARNGDLSRSIAEPLARDANGVLVAAVLIDVLEDGLSMVYSFFDPELRQRSLGNYMIIDHLDRCQMKNLPHLYLGYWVDGSPKMSYKARFKPSEILGSNGWRSLTDDD